MTNTGRAAGQDFTAEIRKIFKIGPRTRWYRKDAYGIALDHAEIVDRVREDRNYRTASDARLAIWDGARAMLDAYAKFIEGYRIDGVLRCEITTASAYEFTAYLGRMIDSGCTNMGEFEQWFRDEAVRANTAVAA